MLIKIIAILLLSVSLSAQGNNQEERIKQLEETIRKYEAQIKTLMTQPAINPVDKFRADIDRAMKSPFAIICWEKKGEVFINTEGNIAGCIAKKP